MSFTLNKIKHENIVQLNECFRIKGQLYIAFEYVEKNLLQIIEVNPNELIFSQMNYF